ncbi:MAG TPA: glucose-1-phosphate thymidylyltransferase [Anaerolineae bacterium]|nr:glucose-1-phosphate thymidylyltransferase [Anaerolineae bacterium]
MLAPTDFFDLSQTDVAAFFEDCTYVWEGLQNLKGHVARLVGSERVVLGEVAEGAYLGEGALYIGEGARIEPGAYVQGPSYIGAGAVVRHGAFVRENSVILSGAIVGHATEVKHSLLLPGAHAPHFNYVGDSILGQGVNLGAGTKLSNLTMVSEKDGTTGKRPTLKIVIEGQTYDTGLAKLGGILGDGAQTGCNSVLNPGTLLGKGTLVYANLSVAKGYYGPRMVLKLRQKMVQAVRRG